MQSSGTNKLLCFSRFETTNHHLCFHCLLQHGVRLQYQSSEEKKSANVSRQDESYKEEWERWGGYLHLKVSWCWQPCYKTFQLYNHFFSGFIRSYKRETTASKSYWKWWLNCQCESRWVTRKWLKNFKPSPTFTFDTPYLSFMVSLRPRFFSKKEKKCIPLSFLFYDVI